MIHDEVKKKLRRAERYRRRERVIGTALADPDVVYAPNSIWHGTPMDRMSEQTCERIEAERKNDFIDYLFEHSGHMDHASFREAWREFEEWERRSCMRTIESLHLDPSLIPHHHGLYVKGPKPEDYGP